MNFQKNYKSFFKRGSKWNQYYTEHFLELLVLYIHNLQDFSMKISKKLVFKSNYNRFLPFLEIFFSNNVLKKNYYMDNKYKRKYSLQILHIPNHQLHYLKYWRTNQAKMNLQDERNCIFLLAFFKILLSLEFSKFIKDSEINFSYLILKINIYISQSFWYILRFLL
jgi:hypothetical protein